MPERPVPLAEAIEGLYRTFERYPLDPWTAPCMHCHTEEEERAVHRALLRDLRPEDLAGFAGDCLMTWGTVDDFKHFLPRLFEIVATEGFRDDDPDTEIVLGALTRGGWSRWPPEEQFAVERFLAEFWRSHLTSYPAPREVDTVLSSIATAVDDLSPFLDEWLTLEGAAPAIHFAAFLEQNAMAIALGKRLSNPWLAERQELEEQARRWLLRSAPAFVPRLESAFLESSDEDILELLGSAIDIASRTPPT